jgi:protein O-GlcNAc transferase
MMKVALQHEKNGSPQEALRLLNDELVKKHNTNQSVSVELYFELSRLSINLGHFSDAHTYLQEGLKHYPRHFDLWNLLGITLRRLGRPNEAIQALENAIKINPKNSVPLVNKANILLDQKRAVEAAEVFGMLVRLNPKNHEFQRLLGTAYVQMGELQKAVIRFETALRLKPDDIASWIDRIKAATDFEHHDEAIGLVERALEKLPGNHRLIEARIMVLRRAGRFKRAEELLLARIAEAPDDAWAHFQFAETVARFDRETGNKHYKRAVEIEPNSAIYWMNYANSLDRSRYGNEAEHIQAGYEAVTKALSLGPIPSRFVRMARNILVRIGRFDLVAKLGSFKDLGRTWANESLHDALHYHLARVETPEDRYEILEQHRIWGRIEQAKADMNPLPRPAIIEKRSKIRLGIMSSDLRNHPVAYFAMPLFEFLDHNRFEVYCYSWSRNDPDPVQKYLETRVDAFRWHKAISDRDAAELIAKDRVDLLFELGSSTDMNKLEVMAYKAAPIQASWLGYPHSAGLESIDYILVDPFINPPDPALLIEKPFIMPHSWVAMGNLGFNEQEQINPIIPSQRNGFVTYGTANNPYKYSPTVLATWAKTVAATPGSKFMFVRPESGVPSFKETVIAAFAQHGVSEDRLIFTAVRGRHMRWYNEMDISLDTFPQTGGTTTCESMFMGVPVISLVGPAFFERLSYSNLSNAGLGDLCCFTIDDYIRKAVQLAGDTERRKLLRNGLRFDIRDRPLGQPHIFARDFYNMVEKTVKEHA